MLNCEFIFHVELKVAREVKTGKWFQQIAININLSANQFRMIIDFDSSKYEEIYRGKKVISANEKQMWHLCYMLENNLEFANIKKNYEKMHRKIKLANDFSKQQSDAISVQSIWGVLFVFKASIAAAFERCSRCRMKILQNVFSKCQLVFLQITKHIFQMSNDIFTNYKIYFLF